MRKPYLGAVTGVMKIRSCKRKYFFFENILTQLVTRLTALFFFRSVPIQGFLDDYAFLIRGLLDLYEASLDADWLQWAETLQETQDKLFWDEKNAGYFNSSAVDKTILLRGKEGKYNINFFPQYYFCIVLLNV